MVEKIEKGIKTFYVCGECKLAYEDEVWAEKCQAWCKEHNSCNIEIIKRAVKLIHER